jgi:hypothetical protein
MHALAFMNNRPNPPQPPLEEPKQPAPSEQPTEPKPEIERPLVHPVPPQEGFAKDVAALTLLRHSNYYIEGQAYGSQQR